MLPKQFNIEGWTVSLYNGNGMNSYDVKIPMH
ncbi:hypothetical protein FHS15_000740 [Paenibacillus castaneae]|nr:hypothetical protein [Paenibacillus castaneae]